MRCMRAGAREFLTIPFNHEVMAEALARAVTRRPVTQNEKKAAGKLFAFMGAKGGAGATTLACNFAVALAQESGKKTLLIDLDLPLGDAALNLGILAEFSAIDALQAADRLDARFLSQLLVKHSSGVWFLAAPGRLVQYQASNEAIDRLIDVARQEFDNVVVDLGSKLDLMGTSVYKEATSVYLVTQSGIPELRNSNRLISQFFAGPLPKLEIVINRFESRALGFSDEHITKALTRPAQWMIPNDYASVRKMQIDAKPLVLADSAITRQIRKMAIAVSGQEEAKAKVISKKKVFGFF
jgi:pilus assembly protein CpaE